VECCHGYLSGAKYKHAYGPADVTAIHCLSFASVESRLVLPFWYWLTQLVPEKWPLNVCVCVLSVLSHADDYVQGFAVENMKTWKAHWDHQLYKALEHQYQMGLEALNENLPEIKVELTYS